MSVPGVYWALVAKALALEVDAKMLAVPEPSTLLPGPVTIGVTTETPAGDVQVRRVVRRP